MTHKIEDGFFVLAMGLGPATQSHFPFRGLFFAGDVIAEDRCWLSEFEPVESFPVNLDVDEIFEVDFRDLDLDFQDLFVLWFVVG